jgi:SAM-dependent methyltransferase
MADFGRLFKDSLTGSNPYESKLTPRFEYSDLVTFAQNKTAPVYNWFYYKEGYSRDFVWSALRELKVPLGATVLDPFCGTGTTLLAAKQAGYASKGYDILPLGVFVSRVKLEDYDPDMLQEEARKLIAHRFQEPRTRLVDIRFLDMRKVFTPYAKADLSFFRERIMEVGDEKARNFLMLGLMSIIGQVSNVRKDGGVLKIIRKPHLPPVRHMLREKLKRMIRDVREAKPVQAPWEANVGDARSLQLEDESQDAVITSPPYLNFVDYTKVYALELSLLLSSTSEMEGLRRKSLRSHVGAEYDGLEEDGVEPLLGRVTKTSSEDRIPTIVEGYIRDMRHTLTETARVLKTGGYAVLVVGNATLPGVTVDVDLMLAEAAEGLGLETTDIWVANVRRADIGGISIERPTRESAVVLRKR